MAKKKRALTAYQLERQRYWKRMISKWRQSGLSQAVFCRRHKLQVQQFSKWKIRIAKTSKVASKKPAPQADFIEVKSPVSRGVYEIVTPGDYRIRIEGDCRSDILANILSAVSQSC